MLDNLTFPKKDGSMKDNPAIKKETPKTKETTTVSSVKNNHHDDPRDKKSFKDKSRIKELEKELSKRESEIAFLKDKIVNDQEIIIDVIEEKKQLKKTIQDYEMKELDMKLNNYLELQRKHHKTEHRLFVTKNLLDDAQEELEFRAKVIEDLENKGLSDFILKRYPDSFLEYKKK